MADRTEKFRHQDVARAVHTSDEVDGIAAALGHRQLHLRRGHDRLELALQQLARAVGRAARNTDLADIGHEDAAGLGHANAVQCGDLLARGGQQRVVAAVPDQHVEPVARADHLCDGAAAGADPAVPRLAGAWPLRDAGQEGAGHWIDRDVGVRRGRVLGDLALDRGPARQGAAGCERGRQQGGEEQLAKVSHMSCDRLLIIPANRVAPPLSGREYVAPEKVSNPHPQLEPCLPQDSH